MTIKFYDLGRFQEAYLDYLEGDRDEPPEPKDLVREHRRAAVEFIRSITATRGIDPYASRPSIEQLLTSRSATTGPMNDIGGVLQDHLRETIDPKALVTADAASRAIGLASALVIQTRGIQMRAVPETISTDLDDAITGRAEDIARVFSAFPDCHAVLYTTVARQPHAVVLHRGDVYGAIETPSGRSQPPRLRQPVAPATVVCEAWFKGLIPEFEPLTAQLFETSTLAESALDTLRLARRAVAEVLAAGRRARIDAKRETWTELGDREVQRVAAIVAEAQVGPLPRETYESHLEQLLGKAA